MKVHISDLESELLDKVKEKYPELNDMTYTAVVHFCINKVLIKRRGD